MSHIAASDSAISEGYEVMKGKMNTHKLTKAAFLSLRKLICSISAGENQPGPVRSGKSLTSECAEVVP